MEEKRSECSEKKPGSCECGSRCGLGVLMVLLFLVGGVVGYLAGQRGMCRKMMKTHSMRGMSAASPEAVKESLPNRP